MTFEEIRQPRGIANTSDADLSRLLADSDHSTSTDVGSQLTEAVAIQQRLTTNIRIYVIAEKYDVAPLKGLAQQNFSSLLFYSSSPLACLPEITQEVFTLCPDHDSGLQNLILSYCSYHLQHFITDARMQPVIIEYPAIASAMLNESADRMARAKPDLALARQNWLGELDECLKASLVNQPIRCRSCEELFNGYIQRAPDLTGSLSLSMKWRCGNCHTWHAS